MSDKGKPAGSEGFRAGASAWAAVWAERKAEAARWAWYYLQIGDHVTEIDGRHVGRIVRIENSVRADVCWLDTGWLSKDLDTRDLMKAPRD